MTLEEFKSSHRLTDDIFSNVTGPEFYDVTRADFISNRGYVYSGGNEDFPPYVEVIHSNDGITRYFVTDGSIHGNTYDTLEEAEVVLFDFVKGEFGMETPIDPEVQARIDKHYLVAGFERDTKESYQNFLGDDYKRMKVRDTTLGDDRYATVENASNVYLEDDDTVCIDRFGRVDAFEHNGEYYTIAYS